MDDNLKNTLGLTLKPIKELTLRAYADKYSWSGSSQSTLAFFAGVRIDNFSLGGEYNYQTNNNFQVGNDFSGFSFYSTYKFLKKYKVFARFDHLESVVLDAVIDPDPWNLNRDGDKFIGGLEFTPIKNVNLALNYQYFAAAMGSDNDVSSIHFNLQVAF